MLLPNAERAVIEPVKLHGYLLSNSHLLGRFRSRSLLKLGFTPDRWPELEQAFRDQLLTSDAEFRGTGPYGQLFTLQARLDGRASSAMFTSVWLVPAGEDIPRFVTIYPAGGQ